jgi:hypothetical protein
MQVRVEKVAGLVLDVRSQEGTTLAIVNVNAVVTNQDVLVFQITVPAVAVEIG